MGLGWTKTTVRWALAGVAMMVGVVAGAPQWDPRPPSALAWSPRVTEASGVLPGVAPRPGIAVDRALRKRLVDAADRALEIEVQPRDPLEITDTNDPFVRDARAAWTLALAGRVTGQRRYGLAAGKIVDAWATVRSTRSTCPQSGGCSTSLMIGRAAPAFVFAVTVLHADGGYGGTRLERFHRWLRTVILPAASDRAGNWGDAGTFLRAAVAVELRDRGELDEAVRRWRGRMDLMGPDGRIPEEMRRGDASLMYSQEALSYRVVTAEIFSAAGVDVWDYHGRRGGTLRAGLELVARGLEDPGGWPGGSGHLRVPGPSSMWSLVARRWPTDRFEREAARARAREGSGHSAVVWLAVTHGS